MTSPTRPPADYQQSRTIILLLGLIVLTIVGGTMWVRGVEPVEVSATIFFIPLFAAVVFFGVPGGLTIGALAALAYVFIRIPSLRAVGFQPLAGLLVARIVGYLVFGAVGGWAVSALTRSVVKLEQVDDVDDETSLSNARSFVEKIELERARVERYGGEFSTVVIGFDGLDLDRRARASLMQSLGTHLRANVRTVDDITHARDGTTDLFGFVLPATGAAGTDSFVEKLTAALDTIVPNSTIDESLRVTFPGSDDELSDLVDRFREISRRQHPATT